MSVSILLSAVLFIGVTACGETTEEHKHTFSDAWTYDDTNHWHAATCDHKTEVSGKAAHTLKDGACTVCGYRQSGTPSDQDTTFNVVFNLNYQGGGVFDRQTVKSGEKAKRPDGEPTRDGGYSFTGWYTTAAATTLFDFETPITKATVVYAGWSSSTVTVSFNYNYVGAPAMRTVTVTSGQTVQQPETPERDDYAFDAWYMEATCEHPFDFTTPVSANITLYAGWTLTTAEITFDLNYKPSENPSPAKVTVGERVTAPTPAPEREGYDFGGWYTEAACTTQYNFEAAVTENLTLYAKWTIKTYTVTFHWNYGNEADTTETVEHGKPVSEPEERTRDGWSFAGWYLEEDEYIFSTPVTSDLTLTAHWEQNSTGQDDTFTVTFHLNYGTGDDTYKSFSVKKNQRVSVGDVPAPERENYYFMGWYTDAGCTTEFSFDRRVTASISVYAKWYRQYTFEAEYTDLDGKTGLGYSNNGSGPEDLIIKDDRHANASNGFWVGMLFYNGANLQFVIESDREVTDAVVILRIQAMYAPQVFNPERYSVTVNGEELDYDEISLYGERDDLNNDIRPFENFIMNTRAHLVKGRNTITLTVTNSDKLYPDGTMNANSPIVDCIYVCTDATLSWTPKNEEICEQKRTEA